MILPGGFGRGSELVSADVEVTRALLSIDFGQRIIDAALGDSSRRPQVLVELSDSANQGLIDSRNVETLVSPMLVSQIMAQVALKREIRLVFEELFTQGGAEIVFRPAADYRITARHSFAALEARVAEQGEILLGVWPDRGNFKLNPPREQVFDFDDQVRLCILGRA